MNANQSQDSKYKLKLIQADLDLHRIELETQNEEMKVSLFELETARFNYRALFDAAPIGYIVFDKFGKIHQTNNLARVLFGAGATDVVGQNLSSYVTKSSQEDLHFFLLKLHENNNAAKCSLRLKHPAHNPAHVRLDGVKRHDRRDHQALCSIVDISEQVTAGEELEKSRQEANQAVVAKQMFISNMSHEFRTPLNGILGMTDIVLNSELHDDQRKQLLIVKESAKFLNIIVDQILDFTKFELEHIELKSEEFNLHKLIFEVVAPFEYLKCEKQISLKIEIDDEVPNFVIGDGDRLKQILTNLVGNAVKFTPASGTISISIGNLYSTDLTVHLVFKIHDTGIGIPKDMLESVFEPFTQVDASDTRPFGGTGLGLTISNKLAICMGGRIVVESTEGQHSTFSLILPFKPRPPEPVEG